MRTVLRRRAVRTAALAAALVGLIGGAVTVAPSASAAGICQTNIKNHWRIVDNLGGAHVRSGPGTIYRSLYELYHGDVFLAVCSSKNVYGTTWYYGKDGRGRKGFISVDRTSRD